MATLYIIEQGASVNLENERMVVSRDGQEVSALPLIKITDVVVFGNCSFSLPTLKRLLDRGVELSFLTVRGRYQGRLVGMATPHVGLRRDQYRKADDPAWALDQAQRIVNGKLRNCRALLQRFARNRSSVDPEVTSTISALSDLSERVQRTTKVSALLGVEGSATARYFRGLRALFDPAWNFQDRNRRPPTDPVNAALSLGYTLLQHHVLGAVQTVGFDPYLGYLHQPDYHRPSLALDMMEEFRPLIIDSLVLRCCSDGRLTQEDFSVGDDESPYAVRMSDEAKRRFIKAYEERVRIRLTHPEGADRGPGEVDYARCFELQARRLARAVRGGEPYQPMFSR
ncbi:CRISPR-associated endonuclease Cas1 [Candidatus Chloroploca sp. Khr17]|uniref:CRISPR-associated endonuclease Cas1 n=1 Tax=Candidatus Chloroploca sp. Khr17 TaxID=2496869 RepID=UPI00101BDEB2|nr:CRISPR-associated endonuclease Cas1 [Candidatus Chloroploca sp. Khr17]